MALVLADRVKETSVTAGTGTFTLDGAVNGYQTFAAAIGSGNTCYYTIAGQVSSDWEVGIGTVGSGTLARTTVLSSSNGGALVNFIAGTKDVFVTYPAEKSVYRDSSGNTVQGSFNSITSGSIALTTGTISTTPASNNDITNKSYVDGLVATGLTYHQPVQATTTQSLAAQTGGTVTYNNGSSGVGATITLSVALNTLDGYTLLNTNRILVKDEVNQAYNGVYTWATGGTVLTRATDADTYGTAPNQLSQNDYFFTQNGTVNKGTSYVVTTVGTITFGTTAITFAEFSSSKVYSAGTGLTLTDTTFSITNTGTAGTYGSASQVPVFVTNAQGQVTSATNTAIAITSAAVSGLAASATTDTTNATNITSGTLPAARLSGSYTGITGVGTIAAGTWQGSAIGVAYGGTGFTGYTTGDLIYASGASTLAKLAAGTNGYVLTMAGGVPSWAANSAVTTFSAGTTGLTPSTATSGAVTLAGTLVVANGGTGLTSVTANRIPYGNGTGALNTSANLTFDGTTLTNTGNAIISDNSANAALRITQVGAGNALLVEDSANPDATPVVIDNSGNLILGSTATVATPSTFVSTIQSHSAANQNLGIGLFNYATGVGAKGDLAFYKSLSGTSGTLSAVSTNVDLGSLNFFGAGDASTWVRAAQMLAEVDTGTVSSTSMPGRLLFYTTPDGSATSVERMRIDSAGQVGIGATASAGTTLRIGKSMTGAVNALGVYDNQVIQSDVTASAIIFSSFPSTAASAFTLPALYHFSASQNSIGATSAVTNQYGFFAGTTLTGATNNYGFYSNIAAGTGRWNFYAANTANNYFAGNVGVGSTSLTNVNFRVSSDIIGAATSYATILNGFIQPTVTASAVYSQVTTNTAANGAVPYTVASVRNYSASQGAFNADSTVTNQFGFAAESTLTGATNNYGFWSNIASGTGRWNFYANGTADNYFAGNVGLGTTTPGVKLDVADGFVRLTQDYAVRWHSAGTIRGAILADSGSNMVFQTGSAGTERFRITSSGAISVGSSGTATGTNGQVLTSAGSGAAPTWTTPVSSNITANGLWENAATISSNYTIGTNNNAVSAGPITVASGVVVTVPSGSTWVVV